MGTSAPTKSPVGRSMLQGFCMLLPAERLESLMGASWASCSHLGLPFLS